MSDQSERSNFQEAKAILADTKSVSRGSAADQSMLTEALIHAVLAVADAIQDIDERLGDRL